MKNTITGPAVDPAGLGTRASLRQAIAEWRGLGGEPVSDQEFERRLRQIDSRLERAREHAPTSNRARGLVRQLEAERESFVRNVEEFRVAWLRARDAAEEAEAILIEGAPKARQDAVAAARAERDEIARRLEEVGRRAGWEARTRLGWALSQAEDALAKAIRLACEDDTET